MTDVFLRPGETPQNDVALGDPSGVSATVSLTGLQITSAVGTPTATGAANVAVTGRAATAAFGTVSESGTALKVITGRAATSAFGTISESGTALIAISGRQAQSAFTAPAATGEIGSLSATVALGGQQVLASAGTLIAFAVTAALRKARYTPRPLRIHMPGTVAVFGVAAETSFGFVTANGGASATLAGGQMKAAHGRLEAEGIIDISDDELLAIFGMELTA